MFYKILLLLAIQFFSACLFSIKGQDNNVDFTLPDIVPVSPEAKGLGKFGDVPVGTYTGTPDISIPIYTIQAGKLSLPITLSYHATGIEVNQEATWVGLGWNLIAGGTISYIPVKGNDQTSGRIRPEDFQNLLQYLDLGTFVHPYAKHEDKFVGWSCVHQGDISEIIKNDMLGPLLGGYEQQDVYSANFAGYSFKFIKNPLDGSYVFLGQKNKCKIEGGLSTSGFVITGEDGTIYRFEGIEYQTYPISWLLTKVISPTGETITLKYKDVITDENLPSLSESYTIKDTRKQPRRTVTGSGALHTLYLETIETNNELVVFDSNNDRIDLAGALQLNDIVIKDKVNQIEKYSYHFGYNYFTGSTTGGDYLNDGQNGSYGSYNDNQKGKRLKLESLIQGSNNIDNEKYAFSYYESVPLPLKTSFAIDHWGYYNGQENRTALTGYNHTIIPKILPLITGDPSNYDKFADLFYPLEGAVRGASRNADIYSAGMLKSIQYPTKGKTVFTYEPHDYNNYKYYSAEDEPTYQVFVTYDEAQVIAWGITPYPVTNVTESTFTLTTGKYVTFSGFSDFYEGTLTIEGVNVPGFTPVVYSNNIPDYKRVEWNNEQIWLNPGTYKLKCNTPPSFIQSNDMYPEIQGKVIYGQHYNYKTGSNSNYHIGGGLRIKNIVNFDENDKVVSSKKYSYVDESGNTTGKLLIPLKNFDIKDITVGYCPHFVPWYFKSTASTLYGSSYVSLSGYLIGNNVGYSRVVVESFNNSGGTNGKEIFYYDNCPGSLYFGKIPFYPGHTNGNLLKKVVLNANGDTVLIEKNNYGIINNTEVALNVYMEDLYEGPTGICIAGVNPLAYVGRYMIYVYPTQNFFNALTSKETSQYFSSGEVKETTEYTYNPENFCIKSATISTSIDNTKRITEFKYPFNYSEEPYPTMNTVKNIINPVIEQTEKVNTTFLQSTKTNYKDWFGDQKIIAPETVVATKGSSTPDTRIRFKYNMQGNIIETSKENDVKTCYLWGYNNSFPVVKIEGKAEAEISQTLKDLVASHVFSCKTDYTSINSDMNWLKTQLSSILTDNTCFVTFFTYDPVFGMTSSTNPNGVTSYYEYDPFGRLKCIKDDGGHILKTYEYNYKH